MNFNDARLAETELRKALDTGDPRVVVRVLLAHGWPLYHERHELLTAALASLPPSVVERNPALGLVHPMAPIRSRTGRSSVSMLHPDDARSMSPDHLDLMVLVQQIAARMTGDVETAMGFARRLSDRLVQVGADSRERTDGPMWFFHHQIGSTSLAAGDTAAALQEFATARQLAQVSQYPWAERMALGRAAVAHVVRGSVDEAALSLERARALPEPTAAHRSAALATEAAAAALISVERMSDDIDACLAHLESYDSYELTWPFALLARVRAALARHQPYDALEQAKLARDAHPSQHGSFATDVVASAQIRAYIAIGDLERARRIAAADRAPGVLTRLATAHLHLYEGNIDTATHAIRSIGDSTGPGQRAEAVILTAWADLTQSGDIDAHIAHRVHRLAVGPTRRRLLATTPHHLIDRVRSHLGPEAANALNIAISGLSHPDVRARPSLTPSELRVLQAMRSNPTTADIAAALHVSPNTVKSQLRSLYRKLECSSRDDAIMAATRWRLLPPTETPASLSPGGSDQHPGSTPARPAPRR